MDITYTTIDTYDDDFGRIVDKILNEPEGWPKYSVRFIRNDVNPEVRIHLVSKDYMTNNFGRSFTDLSCYDPYTQKIYINYYNWTTGGQSKLSIDDYRKYVINHETGHHLQALLGIRTPHPKVPCSTCKCSVMNQMTLNPDCVHVMYPHGNTLEEALGSTPQIRGGSKSMFSTMDIISIPTAIVLSVLVGIFFSRN